MIRVCAEFCGSKSGGKITFGTHPDTSGVDRKSVDPWFLQNVCKGVLPARFSGPGMDSLVVEVSADA